MTLFVIPFPDKESTQHQVSISIVTVLWTEQLAKVQSFTNCFH